MFWLTYVAIFREYTNRSCLLVVKSIQQSKSKVKCTFKVNYNVFV